MIQKDSVIYKGFGRHGLGLMWVRIRVSVQIHLMKTRAPCVRACVLVYVFHVCQRTVHPNDLALGRLLLRDPGELWCTGDK